MGNQQIERLRPVVIRAGRRRDYLALARFHYRAGPPATVVRVRVAWVDGERAGVLVVSMPTLNGWWRREAWPGRYHGVPKTLIACRLNAELRTLSRVVIDPRFRGLGLSTLLVRRYLARPLTVRTEAVAAMGRFFPFFARAGMVEHRSEGSREDVRLRRRLARARLDPAWLVDEHRARVLLRRHGWLGDLVRTWARRRRLPEDLGTTGLAAHLGQRLAAPPIAYTHERKGGR